MASPGAQGALHPPPDGRILENPIWIFNARSRQNAFFKYEHMFVFLFSFSKKAGSDRRGDPHIFSIFFRKGLKTMDSI